MNQEQASIDAYVQYGRRCIKLAIVFILILSSVAILNFASIDITLIMTIVIPFFIVFSIVWLQSYKKKNGLTSNSLSLKEMFADELRVQSINNAYRSSFLLIIISQLPLSILLNTTPINNVHIILATTTIVLGITSFLAFFLYYDR